MLPPDASYCGDIGKRLFYHEIGGIHGNTGSPTGGDICVKQRFNPIPPVIADVNAAAHSAIAAYETDKKVQNSPWRYYKLVNVQAYPFDKTQIDNPNPNGQKNRSTFFQANGVVETDYTLQNFSGRLVGNPTPEDPAPEVNSVGASSDYPKVGRDPDFKNTHIFSQLPPAIQAFNMGGCQGCHANAQRGGTDFSFILDGNSQQSSPDTPTPENAAAAAAKYKLRFLQLE